MGYIGIMPHAGPSYMGQCIIGDGGKHCMGSGIMGMKWGGAYGIAPGTMGP